MGDSDGAGGLKIFKKLLTNEKKFDIIFLERVS